jgi:hypothetical protein
MNRIDILLKTPFACVLFGGESNWTVTSIRDLKHLSEGVKKNMKPLQLILKMM